MITFPVGAVTHEQFTAATLKETVSSRPAQAITGEPFPAPMTPPRLTAHLRAWLGAWPPRREVELVVWPGRDLPAWNGGTWPLLGVESPAGTVLSVSPALIQSPGASDGARIAAALKDGQPERAMPAAFRRLDLQFGRAVLRWAAQPVDLPEIGEWVGADDRRLPAWLRIFNGGILVAWDTEGQVAAGVGIKRHNAFGHELAVGTEPAHRGRGLARLLVAQAARRVLADGAIPLYLHAPGNLASARVADAAGFPDRGWRLVELS